MPDRRAFLRFATAVGGAIAAALAGIPALRAFVSPAFRRKAGEKWIKVGDTSTFETGIPVKVDFVDTESDAWVESRVLRNVWLYTDDGENFTVFNGRCTHLGCSYGFDKAAGAFVCPCHQGKFDLKTGAVLGGPPPRPLDQLQVKVEDGILYAAYRNYRLGVPQQVAV
jgi:menaquinol-cytochrome c reductase iron-sulfur subunit